MRTVWIVAWLGLAGIACDGSNPVAPVDFGEAAPATSYTVSLTADPTTIFAGITTKVTITISVVANNGGQSAASISVSTSLGTFSGGEAVTSVDLDGSGRGTLELDPGDEPGTAELLARTGDSAGSLTLEVKDPGDPPEADFEFEIDDLTVIFTDKSSNDPTSWKWDFGDDQRCDSACTQQNPVYTYTDRVTYQVNLTASNAAGLSGEITKFVAIEPVPDPPVADFSYEAEGLSVLFLYVSNDGGAPDTWLWDFGDGTTSEVENPGHLYEASGNYPVTLEVANTSGRSSVTQRVEVLGDDEEEVSPEVELAAAFSTVRNLRTVIFNDDSAGEPVSWMWDFGDGSESGRQSPVHEYPATGTTDVYPVSLTVTDADGNSDTLSRFVCVNDDPPDSDCPETTGG